MVNYPVPGVRSDSRWTVQGKVSHSAPDSCTDQFKTSISPQGNPGQAPGDLTNTYVCQGSGEFDQFCLHYPEKHTHTRVDTGACRYSVFHLRINDLI